MGVRVEKYIAEIGFMYDEYPTAGSWFIAANGEMQIYIGRPEEEDASMLLAEYGAGQFVRAFFHPLPTPQPEADEDDRDKGIVEEYDDAEPSGGLYDGERNRAEA